MPTKAHHLTTGLCRKLQLACNWLGKVHRLRNMSSLWDMSNLLFISMTVPKVLLQHLSRRCVECAIHHERGVHEELHQSGHMYMARTSNNRVIPMEWSCWVTSNNACEASEHVIVFANGDDKCELVISIDACCHSVKLCALVARAFRPQQWHNTFRLVSILPHEAQPVVELFCLHLNTIDWSGHVTSTIRRDNWWGFKSLWLWFKISTYDQGLGSNFRFRGSVFRVRV